MDIMGGLGAFGGNLVGYLVPFLFVLTIVVFFHELGHFLVARWCGIRILTFSIGFGPEIEHPGRFVRRGSRERSGNIRANRLRRVITHHRHQYSAHQQSQS
jgi:regulator of sigma E protease